MEFHDLGKHCSAKNCGQQDFLPFTCNACAQVFCLDHRSYAQHSCSNIDAKDKRFLECSKCNKVLRRPSGVDDGILLERHLASGCAEGIRKIRSTKFPCSVKGCRVSEFLKITCRTCRKSVCVRHRHEEDHKCEGVAETSILEFLHLHLLKRVGGGAQGPEPRSAAENPLQLVSPDAETFKFGVVFLLLFGSFFFRQFL